MMNKRSFISVSSGALLNIAVLFCFVILIVGIL
jgi:hypothetical protein